MTENTIINDLLKKKEWHTPELFHLDLMKTMGGDSVANYEDEYNNNPTSP